MVKEYTVVTYKRDFNTKVVSAVCFYWENGKRIKESIVIPYYFFYADSVISFDPKLFDTQTGFTNVFGKPVNKIIPKNSLTPDDYKLLQANMKGFVFETDVRAIDRWLWEVKPKFSKNLRIWYIDIEILRNDKGQYSSVNEAENKVASITYYDNFNKKYYLFLLTDKDDKLVKDDRYIYCFRSEERLLEAFLMAVNQQDPDYFTGWNVVGFDMPYLIRRMQVLEVDERKLSPLWSVNIRVKTFKNNINFDTTIKGRGIIDLMEISKQFWLGTDVGYSLESQSRKWLGEGKIKIGDIDKAYKTDFWHFVDYNVKDVELCVKLDAKKRLLADMQEFQDVISINLNETPIAGKIINYYIKQKTDIILDDSYGKEEFELPGGYVHPVDKGIFRKVHKFDFASHYPAAIRSYNISPDTIVYNPTEEQKKDLIHFNCYYRHVNEEGTKGWQIVLGEKPREDDLFFEVWFRKDIRGCITKITDDLTIERLGLKRSGNKSRSTVVKRMINSIYGQFGYKYSRFFNKDCAKAITLICQWLTCNIISRIESNKYGKVIMGDTDSFAVDMYGTTCKDDIQNCAKEVFELSKKEHNLDKVYSDLELEVVIDKMVLFGVKKKYAQYTNGEFKLQGLEVIRKDFPEAVKDFQREILNVICLKEDPKLSDVIEIRRKVETKIRQAINTKNHLYYSMPTVIKKSLIDYESNTQEKKALHNSKLHISINETFYILLCSGGKDLAFRNVEELEKFNYQADYSRIVEKVFNNISIFEDLFKKQTSLLNY
jgi:DNA polymerase, archaea type